MKKRLLTLLGGALLGLFSMNAAAENWVDVTDTYLSNADFSSGDAISLHLCGYQADIAKDANKYNGNNALYWAQDVTDWTVSSAKADGSAGALFAYGSDQQMKGNQKSAPATNPAGEASGKALGIFAIWTGTIQYTQEVTLPAGHYKFQYTYYNQSGTETVTNYCGFVPNSGTASYAANTKFTTGSWKTVDVEFTLGQETAGKISLGFQAPNKGSGSCPMLFIDNVKLQFDNTVDKTNLSALITTAEGLYSVSGNEAAALKTAIDAAKAVNTNTAATIADVLGAESNLQAAIDAYKLANASEANPVDMTSYLKNPSFESGASDWTLTKTMGGWEDCSIKTTEPSEGNKCYNFWAGQVTSIDLNQNVTLPAGKYKLYADFRIDNINNVSNQGVYATVGGTTSKSKATIATVASTWESKEGWNTLNVTFATDGTNTVTLGASSTGDGSSSKGWFQIDNFKLEYIGAYNACEALLDELQSLVDEADALIKGGANVGSNAFQIPTSVQSALETAYQDADDVVNSSEDADEIQESIEDITAALEAYKSPTLNAPSSDKRYSVKLVYGGWTYNNKAMTYIANGRSDAGKYNIQYLAEPAVYYAQAFQFTAVEVEGQKNCYKMSQIDNDGVERYICTGVPYGGNTSQIRTTTEVNDALVVEVRVTSTNGKWNLWNTEANNYIGSQDAGVYTVNSHIDFTLAEAPKATATLSVTDVHWGTFIAPFDVTIPEGVEVYECTGVDGTSITMEKVETTISANTPVLVYSESEKTENFSDYGHATKSNYEAGIMVGTFEDVQPEVGKYLLQKNEDSSVTFNKITESVRPWVRANRCYLSVPSSSTVLRFGDATGIQSVEQQGETVIYDLTGRRVDAAVKGIYIVNGKKMLVE